MTKRLDLTLAAVALAIGLALSSGAALAQSNGGGGGGGAGGNAGGSGTDAWINPAFLVATGAPGQPGTVPRPRVQDSEAPTICGIQDGSGRRFVHCDQRRR